ncbi:MAG: M20/M25/M40 family metallo-hydrolase [Thermofilaceae archaeon]
MNIDLVEELCRLVRIRSEVSVSDKGDVIRSSYMEAAEAVVGLAERVGLSAELIKLEYRGGIIPTVFIEVEGSGRTLALVSHYDVVPTRGPWYVEGHSVDPYEPFVCKDRVYGRGAADDKSAIVASIAAFAELANAGDKLRYRPCIVVTGDEEVGGYGVRAVLEEGYRWDKAVILDAGAEYVSVGASGVIHGWIKVKGRSGHAGYPHKTVNPVEAAVKLANILLEEYKSVRFSKISRYNSPPDSPFQKVWGRFSITITKLGPGEPEKHNRVPSEVLLGFDVRLLPEEDMEEALTELYSYFSRATARLAIEAEIKAWGQRGWYTLDKDLVDEAVEAAQKSYAAGGLEYKVPTAAELGGNDGTFFFEAGIPVVAFGAIRSDCNVHSENEFVYIRDLFLLKEFVKNMVRG